VELNQLRNKMASAALKKDSTKAEALAPVAVLAVACVYSRRLPLSFSTAHNWMRIRLAMGNISGEVGPNINHCSQCCNSEERGSAEGAQ
jgi:hypothetical protein